MWNHTSPCDITLDCDRHHPGLRPHRYGRWVASISLVALVAVRAGAQGEPLEVGVRSTVPDTTYLWSKNKNKIAGEGGHGKVYALYQVSQIKAPEKLVKPVDEKYIANILLRELDANGFHEFVAGQKPDILITASYGRAEITNPYIRDLGEVGGMGGVSAGVSPASRPGDASDNPQKASVPMAPLTLDNPPAGTTITGADPGQLMDELANGYQEKLQRAAFEKIFIRITAWQYPTGPKAKPRMLWKTVMVVDDPDHRDLNEVAESMLKAGAPWFDKLPKDREVLVNTTIPDGRVNVGTPQLVEPTPSKPRR